MGEYLGNHPGFLDGGDDFQFATAVFDVDIEYPFQQSGPANANRCGGMGRIVLGIGRVLFVFLRVGNTLGAQFGIRCEYPMEANKIESWTPH